MKRKVSKKRICLYVTFQIAELIGADPLEIIFTSGATESNNLALKGLARFYGKGKGGKKHIITTQIEHKCILESCRHLEHYEGCQVRTMGRPRNLHTFR